ncbi:MAG: carbon-nitrogen hydrolase family protein [Bacteroidetes bacterium]|nr:MAG: carbon-nitrogen hydrolase family protein [Bacteroidota bacterium]
MKICLAQTKSLKGDIQHNLAIHEKFVALAIEENADLIVFPELSLTGYESILAKELATTIDDKRLDQLQALANKNRITICLGLPVRANPGIQIGMAILQPNMPRELYLKKYLHADEEPFFVRGENKKIGIVHNNINIAFAICYELSIPDHSINAFQSGADFYVASVAKTADGVDNASESLATIAKKYSALVMMVNCLGLSDGVVCAGRSSVWNRQGELLEHLKSDEEGILLIDTEHLTADCRYFQT